VTSRHGRTPLRILIAEADLHVSDVLIAECEIALGADVVAARSGGGALQALSWFPPTLALVDLMLPDMCGFEVARYAANYEVPTLLMSGHPEKMLLCEDHGFPHLCKPFSISQLTNLARKVIREAEQNVAQLRWSYVRLQATLHASRRIVGAARKSSKASAEGRAQRRMNQFERG
jgi:DNA-binding response OmpR family regulator